MGQFLSLEAWTPLSHLTFCVYMVHPIVLFVWQLGGRRKEAFRVLDFGMKYVAVTCVSFGWAVVFCMMVEFLSASIMKQYLLRRRTTTRTNSYQRLLRDVEMEQYGSIQDVPYNRD